jgi:hypothetical protein
MTTRGGNGNRTWSGERRHLDSPFVREESFVRAALPEVPLVQAETPYLLAFEYAGPAPPPEDEVAVEFEDESALEDEAVRPDEHPLDHPMLHEESEYDSLDWEAASRSSASPADESPQLWQRSQDGLIDVESEAPAELYEGPDLTVPDDFLLYLDELVDEEVFDGETRSAQQEWQAVPGIHRHFHGDTAQEKFARYLDLRPLYQQAAGASDPAAWINEHIVALSFFGKSTPGHRDLRGPLAAAEDALRRQGSTPRISRFWGFVPRTMRTQAKLSNHALGRAVDIDPATNPHVHNRDEILVIREATRVDLGRPQPHEVMRRASRHFQETFSRTWLEQQSREVRDAAARRRAKLEEYASVGFLTLEQPLIDALVHAGFTWGGNWNAEKDFMHFDLAAGTRAPAATGAAARGLTEPAPRVTITGEQVRFVQRVLNAAQGENLKVDGDYGPLTRGALERFRGRYRLGTGGALDEGTELAIAQRALEELRRQSLFAQFGVMDATTRDVLDAFRTERGLGAGASLDATRSALADALERSGAPVAPLAPIRARV